MQLFGEADEDRSGFHLLCRDHKIRVCLIYR